MCPRTCALGLSSSLLSENKKKTTKVCEIGDRESYFGALFILWIHGKNSHIRTTCKLGGHDLPSHKRLIASQIRKPKPGRSSAKEISSSSSQDHHLLHLHCKIIIFLLLLLLLFFVFSFYLYLRLFLLFVGVRKRLIVS